MFGGNETAKLNLQKQALILESSLNRLQVQTEMENLRAWSSQLGSAGRKRAPLLLVLAPIAGFFLARGARRNSGSGSWIERITTAVKLVGPAIALWKTFSASRKKDVEGEQAAP